MKNTKIESLKQEVESQRDRIRILEEEIRIEEVKEMSRERALRIMPGSAKMCDNQNLGLLSKEVSLFYVLEIMQGSVILDRHGGIEMPQKLINLSLADIINFFARERVQDRIQSLKDAIKQIREKLLICEEDESQSYEERILLLESQIAEMERNALVEASLQEKEEDDNEEE